MYLADTSRGCCVPLGSRTSLVCVLPIGNQEKKIRPSRRDKIFPESFFLALGGSSFQASTDCASFQRPLGKLTIAFYLFYFSCYCLFSFLLNLHNFKSWTRLLAFRIALMLLGKVLIDLFLPQLWVDIRAEMGSLALVKQLVKEKETLIQTSSIPLKN